MARVGPAGPTIRKGRSKQDYATPRAFLDAVERRFGPIAFDLACNANNCVVRVHLERGTASYVRRRGDSGAAFGYTPQQDSLKQDWHQVRGLRWLNPPFSKIEPWALKCADVSRSQHPTLLLTPASVGARWFQKWVVPYAHVIELEDRLCFDGKNPYPKDCILSVYWAGITGRSSWRWSV